MITAEQNLEALDRSRELAKLLNATGEALGINMRKFPLPDHALMLRLGEEMGKVRALKKVLKACDRDSGRRGMPCA